MLRRRVSKSKLVVPSALIAASIVLVAGSREAMDQSPPAGDPTETVRAFMDGFERADLAAVASTLAEDATMFAPFVAARLDGREAIAAAVGPVFDRLRSGQPGPRYLTLEPADMRTQSLRDAAIVTWHLRREGELGRRTAVLEPAGSGWRIKSFHASSFPVGGDTRGRAEAAAGEADGAPVGAFATVVAEPITAAAAPQASALPRLDSYDWTNWLVGDWEGWLKGPSGDSTRIRQSFEYVADARHILTKLELTGADGSSYHGAGIFSYDPLRGLSSGEWFGMFGDRNYALGRRDADRWSWDIHRYGQQRVWRVRERVSEDEYHVTSTSIDAEGRQRVTREYMKRVRSGSRPGS